MKIVFHGTNAANFRNGFEAIIGAGHTVAVVSDAVDRPGEREVFETADVVVGTQLDATQPVPKAARLYQAPAAGTDLIDPARLPAGAALCNAFGHEDAIAEYVIAALLQRHVPLAVADSDLRHQGRWTFWAGRPDAMRSELGSETIGLLGYGHIGKAIAARARAFGMRVTVCNRSKVALDGTVSQSFGLDRMATFMASADHIVVSLPLNDATKGFVGAAALAAMRLTATIINVGRGPVIDEQALYDALAARRIGGAVIDTWYRYPSPQTPETQPSALPFHTLDNVLMTPHMSGWTTGTVRRRQQTIADNIARLQRGEQLINVVATGA